LPKRNPTGLSPLTQGSCNLQGLTVAEDAVYTIGREITRFPLRQGVWDGRIDGVDAQGGTVDCAGDLYWSTADGLYRVAPTAFHQGGGVVPPPERVASAAKGELVVADRSGVYWVMNDGIMMILR
jgi:hypothetical protein